MPTYTGGCHCGRVRYEVTTDLSRVSECNCSMCSMKGFLHVIVPSEQFRMLSGEQDLTMYQFGTRTARHHCCRDCGIASFYHPRSHSDACDGNARCLEGVDVAALTIERFDGRSWAARADAPYLGSWRAKP